MHIYTHAYLNMHPHAVISVCLHMHKHDVCIHANPAIHISLGIDVKDDSVQ